MVEPLAEISCAEASYLDELLSELARSLVHNHQFFAAVLETPEFLVGIVDRARSIPLFVDTRGEDSVLTDCLEPADGEPVGRDVSDFLRFNAVAGRRTLVPGCDQIPAGSLVVAPNPSRDQSAGAHRFIQYYSFNRENTRVRLKEEQIRVRQAEGSFQAATKRLLDRAGNRQIVVPLSDGFDSRIVLASLRLAGAENVVAFSYGKAVSRTAAVSRPVARHLGVPWHFVEYTDELLADVAGSSDLAAYRKVAANASSLPHIQDFPAVGVLLGRGLLDADAVVCPGHGGNVGGSFLFKRKFASASEAISQVFGSKSEFLKTGTTAEDAALLYQESNSQSLIDRVPHRWRGAMAVDAWAWQERKAKYLVNSIRVYEHFGLSWWLPLFDSAVMDAWSVLHPEILKGKVLWCKTGDRLLRRAGGPIPGDVRRASILSRAKWRLKFEAPAYLRRGWPRQSSTSLVFGTLRHHPYSDEEVEAYLALQLRHPNEISAAKWLDDHAGKGWRAVLQSQLVVDERGVQQ